MPACPETNYHNGRNCLVLCPDIDDTASRQMAQYPMTIQPQTQFSNHAASYSHYRIGLRFENRIVAVEVRTGMPACGRTICRLDSGSGLDGSGLVSILNPLYGAYHYAHSLPARPDVACGAYELARCTGTYRNTLDRVRPKATVSGWHRDRRRQ